MRNSRNTLFASHVQRWLRSGFPLTLCLAMLGISPALQAKPNLGSAGLAIRHRLAQASSVFRAPLKAQDNLVSCLTAVVRRWKFPDVGANVVSSSIVVPVVPGQKFKMLKPGEKRAPPPKREKKKREGHINWSPTFRGK